MNEGGDLTAMIERVEGFKVRMKMDAISKHWRKQSMQILVITMSMMSTKNKLM